MRDDLRRNMVENGFDPTRPGDEIAYQKWRDRQRKKIRGNPRKSAEPVVEIVDEIPRSAEIVAAAIYNPIKGNSRKDSKTRKDSSKALRARASRAQQLALWEAPRPPAVTKTVFPADFILPPQWVDFAVQRTQWNLKRIHYEAERFALYHLKKGLTSADWWASWRDWVLNGLRFDAERQAKAEAPAAYVSIESRIQNNGTRFDRMREKLAREGKL